MDGPAHQLYMLSPPGGLITGLLTRNGETYATHDVNLENVTDFSKVCRTCAIITDQLIPIYSGEGIENHLAEKINKHLPNIHVSESDELPRSVCVPCAHTVLAWHELHVCAAQADAALRTRLTQLGRLTEQKPSSNDTLPDNMLNEKVKIEIEVERVKLEFEDNIKDSDKIAKTSESIEKSSVFVSDGGKKFVLCSHCNKNVCSASWQRHVSSHSGERRYSCAACGLGFSDSGNLRRHDRAVHAQRRPHACGTCLKTFSRKSHLEDHVKSHSETRDFVCDVCGKASKSKAAFRMHRNTHRSSELACLECGARFKRRGELRAHRAVHSGERAHTCACGKAFRLRSQLNMHSKRHGHKPPDDPFEEVPPRGPPAPAPPAYRRPRRQACSYCDWREPRDVYQDHIAQQHIELVFYCDECNSYVDKKVFLFHMTLHMLAVSAREKALARAARAQAQGSNTREASTSTNNNDGSPENAPAVSVKTEQPRRSSTRNVERNKKMGNGSASAGPSTQRAARSERAARRSVKTEEPASAPAPAPRPTAKVKAEVMSVTASSNDQDDSSDEDSDGCDMLHTYGYDVVERARDDPAPPAPHAPPAPPAPPRRDSSSEPEEAPKPQPGDQPKKARVCPICSKEYRAASSYFYHLKYSHKGVKEHECQTCGRKFATRGCLTQHVATHSDKCDFECKVCRKKFRSNASLYIHQQTHGGVKSYSCERCDMSFRWRTHLRRHMTRHAAERRHACDVCGHAFAVHCDLLRHRRTHKAGEHKCAQCGSKFAQVRYLKAHVDKKHVQVTVK